LDVFKSLLEDVEKQPGLYKIKFILDDDNGNATMCFLLDSEIKKCDLLILDSFRQLDDEKINMLVSYRINSLKQKTLLTTNRMKELVEILNTNNKPLAEQVRRFVNGNGGKSDI
jgi:DNA replication protein DnaC